MGCCCPKNTQNEGMNYKSPVTKHQGISPDSEHQGMGYATAATQQSRNTGTNDYYIQNLNTLHKNVMYKERRYQISVYRGSFGQHHYIVIDDGDNESITLGLTVGGGKSRILSGQEKAIPEVNLFQGSKDDLDNKGVVDCTLHKLTEIAAAIIRENSYYNLITNNCQTFCNKFLDALGQETYMTDPQKAAIGISGTGFASVVVCAAASS